MKITILSGSPRKESSSIRVAKNLEKYLQEKYSQHLTRLIDVRDYKLPFIDKVFSTVESTPQEWKELAEVIFSSDAYILVSPEYNGGYSPALKNLLDHFPKYSRKVCGLVTASPGGLGGIRAAQQMLLLICGLHAIPSPNMLIVPQLENKFDVDGTSIDNNFQKNIDTFVQEFIWLSEAVYQKK